MCIYKYIGNYIEFNAHIQRYRGSIGAEIQAEQTQLTERPELRCQASLQPWPSCMPCVGDDPRCCF